MVRQQLSQGKHSIFTTCALEIANCGVYIDIGRVATATRWQACARNSQLGVSRSGSSSQYERGQIIWMYSSGGICGSQE